MSAAVPFELNHAHPLNLEDTNSTYMKQLLQHAKAAEISSFMKPNVDPCDDFYEFSCGEWIAINRASRQKLTTGQFERLAEGLDRKLKILLNKDDQDEVPQTDKLVKNFYKSCMKITEIDEPLQQKYKSIIEEFGTMPVLEGADWSEDSFDWVETVSKIAFTYGITIIIGAEVTKDFANNQVNVAYVGQQEFPLESRSMYLSNHTAVYRENYKNMMASHLKTLLGVKKDLAQETAEELIDFEVELAKGLISDTEDISLGNLTTLMNLTEMHRLYAPDIDIERLVKGCLGVRVEKAYDYNPEYQKNLIKVLQRTSKRVVANYIFYSLVDEFFFEPSKTKAKKEEECTAETKKHFAKILDNLVFRNYNNNATSNDIKTIWSELKTVFREQLLTDNSLNWINSQIRNLAVEKLDAMTLEINSYDLEELIAEYKTLNITVDDFLLNQRRIKGLAAFQNRDLLNKPVKPLEASEILTFTPANILVENTIKIPVALLQPFYLWGASYPSAIKFGTLAYLIGHELIHGFDNSGRDYDKEGNAKTWWDEKSTGNFLKRQDCFKQQYSKYFYYDKQLPESSKQAENIADNGGLRLAFAAYRRWLQTQLEAGKDINQLETERLPVLDYSNTKLFFISFAQLWCNDIVPEARNLMVASDDHMPGKFRVIGTLSNFDEFSKEFKCQSGARMNPVHKCTIY